MNTTENIDAEEVAKFDRVSNLWWDETGKMGMLHVINPLRRDFIWQQIRTPKPRIVDVGCGGGILAEALAKKGAQVTGIDLSAPTLEVAKVHAQQSRLDIDYRLQQISELAAEQPASFDVVTCMEMIEHVPDPGAIIAECAKLLKPGGQVFLSTINRNFKAWLFAIIGGEYILRLLPKGTHQYRMLVKPDEMRAYAQAANLAFNRSASLMYNPLFKRFRVAMDKEDVNYMASFTLQD